MLLPIEIARIKFLSCSLVSHVYRIERKIPSAFLHRSKDFCTFLAASIRVQARTFLDLFLFPKNIKYGFRLKRYELP